MEKRTQKMRWKSLSAVQTWWCFQAVPRWSICSAGCVRTGLESLEIGFDRRAHSWWFPHTRLKKGWKNRSDWGKSNQWGHIASFRNTAFCKLHPLRLLKLPLVIDTARKWWTSSTCWQVRPPETDPRTEHTPVTNDLILSELCTNVFTALA